MDVRQLLKLQWDRAAAWAAIVLGALALLLGWLGVSDALLVTEQVPYVISGGLAGVCLIGVGVMLWLSADFRDEWSELHRIADLLERDERDGVVAAAPAASSNGRSEHEPVVVEQA